MKQLRSVASLLPFIAVCLASMPVSGQKDLTGKIDNLMQWHEKYGFNGAVIVVRDGKKIFSKGYGYANRKLELRNSPATAFYIASVSKTITALAVMKLVENGQLLPGDPLIKFFSGVPEKKKQITVDMLLKHTSGMAQTYTCDHIADSAQAIQTILSKTPLVAQPGTRYNYSGDGYSLLAAIVERVSGQRFEDFVASNILVPAGIKKSIGSTEVFGPEDEFSASLPYMPYFIGRIHRLRTEDLAAPAEGSPVNTLKEIKPTWGNKGRSGMILSVEDIYKLDMAFRENKIVGPATAAQMLSAGIKAGGSGYGYGFTVLSAGNEVTMFGHTGDDDNIGHNMSYLNFPKENLQIIVASNNGLYYSGASYSAVVSSLLERLAGHSDYTYEQNKQYPEFSKQAIENPEEYEGVYPSGNSSFHVWINEDQLVLSPVGNEVANTFHYAVSFTNKNELARQILEQTHDKNYDLLKIHSADSISFQRIKGIFANVWASLEKNHGPLQRIDILGTANVWSGNPGADHATWFKLVYKNKSQLYRMEWNTGNKLAGLGGSAIRYPMMFKLKAIARNEFIGFDPGNGRTVSVIFQPADKNNDRIMELNIPGQHGLKLRRSKNMDVLPKRSAAAFLYDCILSKGVAAAIEKADSIQKGTLNRFYLDEDELNDYGYKLLKLGKHHESVALFTTLVQSFPESANGFDSLAEAYLKLGNKTEAVRNYKRSLELNPQNANAKKILAQME